MNDTRFKYNTCYCSSVEAQKAAAQAALFKYNNCYYSAFSSTAVSGHKQIQIQLLLLFNEGVPGLHIECKHVFKYNSCYCSSNALRGHIRTMPFKFNYCYCSSRLKDAKAQHKAFNYL